MSSSWDRTHDLPPFSKCSYSAACASLDLHQQLRQDTPWIADELFGDRVGQGPEEPSRPLRQRGEDRSMTQPQKWRGREGLKCSIFMISLQLLHFCILLRSPSISQASWNVKNNLQNLLAGDSKHTRPACLPFRPGMLAFLKRGRLLMAPHDQNNVGKFCCPQQIIQHPVLRFPTCQREVRALFLQVLPSQIAELLLKENKNQAT